VVEQADDAGDVRLEETGADDRDAGAEEEQVLRRVGQHQAGGDGEAADDHQQATPGDGTAEAEDAVGEEAADEGHRVDEGLDRSVLQVGVLLGEQQLVDHENGQHAAHAVEAEALPHLGQEQPPERARVAALEVADGREPGVERDVRGGGRLGHVPGRRREL
jgi:hypothetical protein